MGTLGFGPRVKELDLSYCIGEPYSLLYIYIHIYTYPLWYLDSSSLPATELPRAYLHLIMLDMTSRFCLVASGTS